jgi:Domain of unknown function (DUF3291)
VNIARLRAPLDSPQLADFVAALEPVNALADGSPGFVWRLQTDDGDATAIRAFDDDMLIVNMSVWESVDALADFTYRSDHRAVMVQRRKWFERMAEAFLVLWWVPAGHQPSVDEAKDRLVRLQRHGPTPEAFTFRSPFPPPDADPPEGSDESAERRGSPTG